MRRIDVWGMLGVLVVSMVWISGRAAAGEEKTLDMPAEDRALLDHYLGPGVVGKPLPCEPIGDPMKYVQFGEDATYSVRITTGDLKGQSVDHRIKHVRREQVGSTWEMSTKTDVLVLGLDKGGNLSFLSHAEPDEGLDGIYSPPAPLLMKGMQPGATHQVDFDVNIVYIDEPERVKHAGLLIKSAYEGKIGPAKVDDTQYRFFVKDVGIVAMVENKDISAFMVYKKQLKVGKLLVKRK